MRGGQGVPVLSANAPAGVDWTQVYAVVSEPNGRQQVGTWSHFDYGKIKPAEDFVYLYEVDPAKEIRPDWPVVIIAQAGHITCRIKEQFNRELEKWVGKNGQ